MTSYFWVKVPLKYIRDAAFNTALTDAQKWRYMQLYMLAKELNAGGAFVRNDEQLSMDDIAWELHLDPDLLQTDINVFSGIGLIASNGHGPYLVRFKHEQDPISDADRKAAQRARDAEQSRNNHGGVTPRDTESESESESEEDLDSDSNESDRKESSSSTGQDEEEDHLQEQKALLCQLAGILKKNRPAIIDKATIIPDDILSELARNYARHKQDPKEVKNPGAITGMNLARGERPAITWYDPGQWVSYIPRPILHAVRPDLFKSEPESKNALSDSDYTHFDEDDDHMPDPALQVLIDGRISAARTWESILEVLERERTSKRLLNKARGARLVAFRDDALQVAAATQDDCELLESSLAITITHILAGMFDRPIGIRFVTQEPNAA